MPDRLSKLVWGLAMAVGLAAVGFGLSVFVEAWQTSRAWVGSAEALHADLPAEAPIWLDQPDAVPTVAVAVAEPPIAAAVTTPVTPTPAPTAAASVVTLATPVPTLPLLAQPVPAAGEQSAEDAPPAPPPPPLRLPAPGEIELAEADFRFLDPPEPGAHARLAVTLQNRADRPTGPLSVALTARWLQDFRVFGAIPAVLDDRPGESERQFLFGGLGPGERQTVELHMLATAEEIDAPEVRVTLSDGAEIARARPRTVAPRPRPGPARALAIPKLGVKAAVVPVPWEPPPFVVGQLHGTAAVSEGNTVLIGHLKGPAGDVFERLDRLRPGDEVVATSRGLEYRFVVSDIAVRPYDDVQPAQPSATPRLTMMTCTGSWSVLRQDYSHRLWVVAEPPELAQQTIRANAERAAQAAREAEAAAAARATHEAEIQSAPPVDSPATAVAAATAIPATAVAAAPSVAATAVVAAPAAPSAAVAAPAVPPVAAGRPIPEPAPSSPAVADPAAVAPASATLAAPSASQTSGGIGPEASAAHAEILAPGIEIVAPTTGAAVPQRLVVRGRRTPEAPSGLPLWLVVRADLEGSRWYALDRPLDIKPDGTWEAAVELGGAAGIRHEIRVGAVDATAEAALRQQAVQRRGQPLEDLPTGFQTGARATVERR